MAGKIYRVSWVGYADDLDYGNTPVEEWASEIVFETDDLDEALETARSNYANPGGGSHPPVMVAPHIHDWRFVDDAGVAPESYYTCGVCAANLTETWAERGLGREDFPGTTEWVKWDSLWLPEKEPPEEE